MKELIQKLMEVGRMDALDSKEKLEAAAEELGYTKEQVAAFLDDFDGFPIDDDALEDITGGTSFIHASNSTFSPGSSSNNNVNVSISYQKL